MTWDWEGLLESSKHRSIPGREVPYGQKPYQEACHLDPGAGRKDLRCPAVLCASSLTHRAGDEIPINLLDLMGDTFHRVYEENGGFQFE